MKYQILVILISLLITNISYSQGLVSEPEDLDFERFKYGKEHKLMPLKVKSVIGISIKPNWPPTGDFEEIPKGTEYYIVGHRKHEKEDGSSSDYFKIRYDGDKTGYVLYYISFYNKAKKYFDYERRRLFIKDNPQLSDDQKYYIKKGTLQIGMSKKIVQAIKGKPVDINRTVTANSVKEQWVYEEQSGKMYIYFEDGVMTSYQE